MRSVSIIPALGLVLALAPIAGLAQTVTLRLNPPTGSTYRYGMVMKMVSQVANQPMSMTTTSDLLVSVISNAGGKIKMKSTSANVHVAAPAGSPMAANADQMKKTMEGQSASFEMDSLGRPLLVDSKSSNPAIQSMMNNMGNSSGGVLFMPKQAVGVGSAWNGSLDMGKMLGGIMGSKVKMTNGVIPIHYKLVSFGAIAGKKIANISMSMSGRPVIQMPAGSAPAGQPSSMTIVFSGSGTMQVDVATGMTVMNKMSTSTNMSIGGQSFSNSMTMTMTKK